jgi:hypothetical protein
MAEPDGGVLSVEVDRLRMKHRECQEARGWLIAGPGQCYECLLPWPCATDQLFTALEAARTALLDVQAGYADGASSAKDELDAARRALIAIDDCVEHDPESAESAARIYAHIRLIVAEVVKD